MYRQASATTPGFVTRQPPANQSSFSHYRTSQRLLSSAEVFKITPRGARFRNNPRNRRDEAEASAGDDFLKGNNFSGAEELRSCRMGERKRAGGFVLSYFGHGLVYLWPGVWPETLGGPQTVHSLAFSPQRTLFSPSFSLFFFTRRFFFPLATSKSASTSSFFSGFSLK